MERPRDDARILLVDDEQEWLDILSLAFADEHWIVDAVSSGREALARLRENRYDLVLCDMSMPGMTGIELLRHLQAGGDDTPFIIMTGVGTIRTAVEAMQFGAYNYITKPFRSDDLTALARQALEHGRMHRSLRRAENSGEEKEAPGSVFPFVLGASSALRNILTTLRRVAVSSAPVLIEGETGTGKSMLARHIHETSLRRAAPLLTIDCGSLPENLLESELFGHVKGAFTGAVASRRGLLEEARGGTVFLDEVGEISPAMQLKLLHAVQEKEVRPVGSNRAVRIDARFICDTNRNLRQCVAEGSFRKDLYYRLAVIPVTLPPLRERGEDLILFIGHFVRKYNGTYGRNIAGVSPAAMRILMTRRWDGNIRELENVMERAVLLTETDVITPASLGDLAECPATGDSGTATRSLPEGAAPERDVQPRAVPLQDAVREAERKAIALALTLSGGSRKEAALLLGIGRRTLYHKLEEYGMELPPRKEGV